MKRGGYIERKTPLRRTRIKRKPARMKRQPPRRLMGMTEEDRAYLAWLHFQPCLGHITLVAHTCDGPIQQAHLRDHTGMGLKEPVMSSAPLCRNLHQQYDQHRGVFARWTLEAMKVWLRGAIEHANAEFAARVAPF